MFLKGSYMWRLRWESQKRLLNFFRKLTTPIQFLEYATPKFSDFFIHSHIVRWQDLQYRVSLEMLKEGEVFSLIDFVDN
jgi:Cu2+-containing amine oxidase